MRFMLDTNTCIFIIKQKHKKVIERFRHYKIGDVGISSITLAELQFGVAKSLYSEKNQIALNEFILPLEIADFDAKTAQAYGSVRAYLEKAGTPIGSLDTLIGAHALRLGVTLVTNNTKEFKLIKNLKVIDWAS